MQKRRTFKRNKTRKKRSYHKKAAISSYLHLARSTIIGIIPLIIIAIGFMTTLIINYKLLDRYNNLQIHIPLPEYSLPKIYFPSFSPIADLLVQKAVDTISTIHITLPRLTLPTITLSLPQFSVTSFLQSTLHPLVNFLNMLNPLPLLQVIGNMLASLSMKEFSVFTTNITQTITILKVTQAFVITCIQQALTGIYWIIINAGLTIINLLKISQEFLYTLGTILLAQLIHMLVSLAQTIGIFLTWCLTQIENLSLFLWKILTSPFIAIHKQLVIISPYINALLKTIRKSTQDLIQSSAAIITFTSQTILSGGHAKP